MEPVKNDIDLSMMPDTRKTPWFEVFTEIKDGETRALQRFDTLIEAFKYRGELISKGFERTKLHIDRWEPDPKRENLPYPVEEYI